jgi:hypothetical protein
MRYSLCYECVGPYVRLRTGVGAEFGNKDLLIEIVIPPTPGIRGRWDPCRIAEY